MKITSVLFDKKIMGVNVALEMTVDEYFRFAHEILKRNEFQRTKVKSSGKTYDLLRHDLVSGCVIPPIVLSVGSSKGEAIQEIVDHLDGGKSAEAIYGKITDVIDYSILASDLIILDGLQRTLTMHNILSARSSEFTQEEIDLFRSSTFRFEVYLGLSRPGILYRMLTLNTGQTPMSFRHQLEILYNDYIDRSDLPNGISVYRETDEKRARGIGKYKYSDLVDMFYAFSTGSPMPYDRQALVSELKEMDFLEKYEFRRGADVMGDLLILFNKFVTKIEKESGSWMLDPEMIEGVERPFGTSSQSILARPQCMTGFGAECKRLVQNGTFLDLAEISSVIDSLSFSREPKESLVELLVVLDQISKSAKKIGDAQRYYFQFSIRHLLTPGTENSNDLSKCWLKGQETYKMMYD